MHYEQQLRYLKQKPLIKPWSIIGDPAFENVKKVLNAICKKNAQKGKANQIVHKQPITKEQVKQLFWTEQMANVTYKIPHSCCALPGSTSPCILVKENERNLTKEIMLLQPTPQSLQYYELIYWLGSKNHQGGLYDSNDESDGKMFNCSTELAKMPGKNSTKLLTSPES